MLLDALGGRFRPHRHKHAGTDWNAARLELAAAYLHDTVEDTETALEDLVAEFGADIAELVYWLTDADEGSPQIKVLFSIWRLARAPFEAKVIKLADVIDNALSIRAHDPALFKVFAAEKKRILMRMAEVEASSLTGNPLFVRAWNAVT